MAILVPPGRFPVAGRLGVCYQGLVPNRLSATGATMLILTLVFCLSSAPASCTDVRVELNDVPDRMGTACMLSAQPHAAKWLETHPVYSFKTFRCETSPVEERKA